MAHTQIAIRMFLVMLALTGVFYPLLITGISQLVMPGRAQGSLVYKEDKIVGSALIGQKFKSDIYFWPRPSAIEYDPLKPSGGSNLGPTSKKLKKAVEDNLKKWNASASVIPADLVYASASGLDPHISLEGAYFQMERIAKARGQKNTQAIKELVDKLSEGITQKRVNVLLLNVALDEQLSATKK